ncbi:MAG: tRNA (N(6)-L-threonylcarbamoyladenosine(37)-C(2))-methylthiotransferase MtaB [Candidatus Pacebacteria bacterium]|nr:tRNA (N(6)-L-threonylcarbamoyladenosine(37)-C(2))-methylthiotransferase MtaB [Candidatus Paceibacterota bacterium]
MVTASIYTLGCRLNQADSALIADDLRRHGFSIREWGEPTDLTIVNSCTVTTAAEQKTRQAVRAARRLNPQTYLVLAGCSANIDADRWLKESAIDLVVPNPGKTGLTAFLPAKLDRPPAPVLASPLETASAPLFEEQGCGYYPHHTRANLKIQEGCDFFCSYCIVPYARGIPRSRDWDDILREARALLQEGHKELVLTGVNIACYNDHGRTLSDLLRELVRLPGDYRIRLSSTEPREEVPRLLKTLHDNPRICRSLHLPIQYGEDTILQAMNRRYSVAEFTDLIQQAVVTVPGICIGSDVIVGFPGETDATFATCLETIADLPFAYLHVFRYSKRAGTPAARLPNQVNGKLAARRHEALTALATRKSMAFAEEFVGRSVEVLTETQKEDGAWEGWSSEYLRVELGGNGHDIGKNQFAHAKVTRALGGRHVRAL